MLDLVPLEKPHVFVPETPSRMMAFLVADVINDPLELRVTVRERPESFLPAKPAHQPPASVDEIGRAVLHLAYYVGQSHGRPETNQHMRVVRHAMDRQELLIALPHNASHVLVKLFLVVILNQIGTTLQGKDNLDVNL